MRSQTIRILLPKGIRIWINNDFRLAGVSYVALHIMGIKEPIALIEVPYEKWEVTHNHVEQHLFLTIIEGDNG